MAQDNILRTFGDVSRVEDVVMRAVEILTAQETSLFTTLQRTVAIDTVHIYLTDTLDTAGDNSNEESADYSFDALTTPSRVINLVQHVRKSFKVSDTQRQVQHYHGEDELSRQLSKKLKSFANDAEYNLLRSTLTSGASGTAPKMDGILAGISTSTNFTAHNSGTTWAATILDGLVKANYEVSNGDLATDLYMGSFLRAVTDTFTAKSNIVVNNPGGITAIVRTVSTYQTSFSTLSIHTHRYIQVSGDATGRVLGIRPEKLALAFLENPMIDSNIARTGPYTPRSINSSFTLEVRNKKSNFFATGFDID
jgi:hypothetical protein